jgi:RNA polymerase sigma-70 factor, ECF subfamily
MSRRAKKHAGNDVDKVLASCESCCHTVHATSICDFFPSYFGAASALETESSVLHAPEPQPKSISAMLDAARNGSTQEFAALFEHFRPYLLLIANEELESDLRAKAGASDLVQESFIDAQRGIANFQGTTAHELLAWLRQILLHNVTDFARRFREAAARRLAQEQALDGVDEGLAKNLVADELSPSALASAGERAALLAAAIERLSDDQRRAVLLRYQENQSFEQIGVALQRSTDAARKLWFRAIENLREHLGRALDQSDGG